MKITRREFLKKAGALGAAGATLGFPNIVRAKPKTLRIAYMPYAVHNLWIKYLEEWGVENGIKIERAPISYNNYTTSLSAQLLLNRPEVDILWHNDDWGPVFGPYLAPVSDIPNIETLAWEYAPSVAFDYAGERRTVLMMLSNDKFFYRSDLVDTPPKTWDEIVDLGRKLQVDGKVKWGLVGGWRYLHSWFTLFWSLWSNGGDIFLPVNERSNDVLARNGWKPGVQEVEHIEMLQFWHDNLHKYKLSPPGLINYTRTDAIAVFQNGDTAFLGASNTDWGSIKNPAKSKVANHAYFREFPLGPSAKGPFWYGAGWGWAIPKGLPTENKELAKEALGWAIANKSLAKDTWYETGSMPPVTTVWDELSSEDKTFRDMTVGLRSGWRHVAPSYYFKTWLEAFSTYTDYCTRAMQGERSDIPKVMEQLAPQLHEIAKSSAS